MADLDDRLQKLEKVEVEGNKIKLTIILDNEELVKEYGGIDYHLKQKIEQELTPIIVKEILDKHKDELIQKILINVDWPEIVRSEVAQRVIREIANGGR